MPPRVPLLCALAASALAAGCGGGGTASRPTGRDGSAPRQRARTGPPRLVVVSSRRLPAPVQLPALARAGDQVLAAGGLSAADSSVATISRVAPGAPRTIGALPQPAHDLGAASLGGAAYVFGGGTAAGPIATITRIDHDGRTAPAGTLPQPLSDTAAATIGSTIYVVGGENGAQPQRTVLAYRPGQRVRAVAVMPHALRYAAVGAVGGRLLIVGGTDGVHARPEILRVDPARHTTAVVGHLPAPLAHAAGVVLDGTFYVLGGRGDALDSQRRTIWAVDARTGRARHAGRLPVALSDLSATADGGGVLVVGGRDSAGRVHDEVLRMRPVRTAVRTAHAAVARIPPLLDPHDVYAAERPNRLSPVVRHDPALVYVPNSQAGTVDVISQRTGRIVRHFATGALPQHVTPSWDLRTLWVTNDLGNSLTPIDPRTGRPGRQVPVLDPYNLYFTADGRRAIVVAEAHRELDFRDPHTMRLRHALAVPQCAGVDHMDFTADGRRALVSCEFAGRMIVLDLVRERVTGTIALRPGAMPQDVKLSPDGRTFYVADMASGGVWLIDARTMRRIRFERTGAGAHGLYPSRDSRLLYVSNRGEGSVSLISFRTRRPFRKWHIPGGGSPDMGGVSADGRVLWLSGRYNAEVYALSTRTGRLLHRIRVGAGPHGICVWPQPGRYSIGHTGILR